VKQRTRSQTWRIAASISAAIAASATAVAAEDTGGTLEEVVVTAQFRAQNLQDTPIAITAVNAEMLEARGQTSITQIAAQAPNVSLRPQPQNGGSGLIAFIRGVGQVDFNYALDPGVGVYVDVVYIPTLSSSLLELMDLDRVEILRGPQGTLAGKNSIGGAIKLFSAKPKGDDSGSLRVSYGSYNALNVRGMADMKLSDTVSLRVSGMSRGSDGYVGMLDYGQTHPTSNVPQNTTRGSGNSDYQTMGGQNIGAGRAALRFTPNDALEINLSTDYTRERSEAIPTVVIAAGAIAPGGTVFNPASVGASNSVGTPWLLGKDGINNVNVDCHFVPTGPYSCDSARDLLGWNPKYVSYSNFLDGMTGTTQAPFKPYFAVPETNFNGVGYMGNLSYKLNENLEFVYIGSYRKYSSKFGQDQDATPIPVAQLDNQLNHHAFTSEVRLNMKSGGGFIEGTIGAFYLKQKGTYTARVDLNYVVPSIDFLHGPDTTPSRTKAVFGTATIHPTDAWSVTGGLRYTKDAKDYTYFRRNPDGSLPNLVNCFVVNGVFSEPNCLLANIYDVTGSFRGDRTDWRIVTDYRFNPNFLAYASVSTGFKGGGVNPRPFAADQKLPFKPETLTTYEMGFKSDLFDRHMRLNGAVFLNKYEDIILGKVLCPESQLPTPCLRPDNIGKSDVKGFELETSIYPADGLSFDASLSYLDFEYTSPATQGYIDGTQIWQGNVVGSTALGGIPEDGITPYTPKLSYAVGSQYDAQMSNGTLSFRLDGSYQGKLYTNAENTDWGKIPGRFLTNARIFFTDQDDKWKLALEVQNLTNKYYFQSKSDITTSLGLVTGVPGLPRTWSLSVERKF
jgi:iron complex outermembrane receptor protein